MTDDRRAMTLKKPDYGLGRAADLRRTADAMDALWELLNRMNDKGSPRKNDAAAWREDFWELWNGLNAVLNASESLHD